MQFFLKVQDFFFLVLIHQMANIYTTVYTLYTVMITLDSTCNKLVFYFVLHYKFNNFF